MENSSKYLENKKFIQWVYNPNDELENWWQTFAAENKNEKETIQQARKLLNILKTRDKRLSEEEKILLFSNILKQIEEKQESGKKRLILISLLKYAAVAVVFFAIGALLFYQQNNINQQLYSGQLDEPASGNETRLIRSNGENIVMDEQKSVIEYSPNGQVAINKNIVKSGNNDKKRVPEINQLIVPYGKTSELWLSDGTKVYLNAGSRLVYPEFFADKNREVLLVGEAFFEVTHNEQHPFVVQTPDIRVRVVGTRFNISAYPTDNIVETVLTEGRVKLEQNGSGFFSESMELEPSQLAAFDKTSRETKIREVDTDNYTLWKDGLFKFESTDLSRVVKKLERYYNIQFHYSKPLLGTIKISGKLELSENREEIINRMAVAASVSISKKEENYYEIN